MISAPPPGQVKEPRAGQENCDQGREERAHLAEAQRDLLTGAFMETGLYLPTSQESSPNSLARQKRTTLLRTQALEL